MARDGRQVDGLDMNGSAAGSLLYLFMMIFGLDLVRRI